ncbi:MAG: calcium-binding protein, partial [Hyphomicrobium sp.]
VNGAAPLTIDSEIDVFSFRDATGGVSFTLGAGGNGVANLVAAGLGTDSYTGIDWVDGSELGDTINGNEADNTIFGHGGIDQMFGAGGSDRLFGDSEGDTLNGGAGIDFMYGGTGDDKYVIDNAGDQIFEDAFNGTNDYVYTSISYTLAAGKDIEGFSANPQAATSPINLTGNELKQIIRGNNGINTILGGGGGDSLYGFGDNDRLEGQAGGDHLTGGIGVDRFVFRESLGLASGIDRIYDFTSTDQIVIDAVSISAQTLLTANQFVLGTTALDANDRVIYDETTGIVRFDADGTGVKAALLFAVLNTKPVISFADFELI